MICVGLSDILYPGGTLGKNSCIVCALLPLLYTPAVTLHSTRITFTFIMLIDMSDSSVPSSRSQYTLRRESQQRSNAVGLAKVYSVCTSNLASHRIVVCAERNRVYSTLTSYRHQCHCCCCCCCCCCCHHALRQRFPVRRGANISVKS